MGLEPGPLVVVLELVEDRCQPTTSDQSGQNPTISFLTRPQ